MSLLEESRALVRIEGFLNVVGDIDEDAKNLFHCDEPLRRLSHLQLLEIVSHATVLIPTIWCRTDAKIGDYVDYELILLEMIDSHLNVSCNGSLESFLSWISKSDANCDANCDTNYVGDKLLSIGVTREWFVMVIVLLGLLASGLKDIWEILGATDHFYSVAGEAHSAAARVVSLPGRGLEIKIEAPRSTEENPRQPWLELFRTALLTEEAAEQNIIELVYAVAEGDFMKAAEISTLNAEDDDKFKVYRNSRSLQVLASAFVGVRLFEVERSRPVTSLSELPSLALKTAHKAWAARLESIGWKESDVPMKLLWARQSCKYVSRLWCERHQGYWEGEFEYEWDSSHGALRYYRKEGPFVTPTAQDDVAEVSEATTAIVIEALLTGSELFLEKQRLLIHNNNKKKRRGLPHSLTETETLKRIYNKDMSSISYLL